MKRIVSVVAVLLFAAPLSASHVAAAGAGRGSLSWVGTNCKEAGSFFLLDPSVVRPFVPERFEIGLVNDTPPLAELVVLTTSCEDISVGGRSGGDALFSEVGVYIENVDTSPGNWHYYGLWNASTHQQLSRSLSRLGITAPFVPDATFSSTTGLADATASVPWETASYDVEVVTPAPQSVFGVRPSVWWYADGKGSYVRVIYSNEQTGALRSGTGLLETSADSALGVMLGGNSRHADQAMFGDYATLEAAVSRVKL